MIQERIRQRQLVECYPYCIGFDRIQIYKDVSKLICHYTSAISGVCQELSNEQIIGTRFLLTLPPEFRYDRGVPGFKSERDSSIIFISEIENPYTFNELIQKRISTIQSLGGDTSDFQRSTFDGYPSVQFTTNSWDPGRKLFVLIFGADNFVVDVSIMTSKERLEELRGMVKKGKYNKLLRIDVENLLGFTASFEGTELKVFKKDANTLNTKQKDESENVVSWLNLTRMPKSSYEGLNLEEAIDATYQLYKFDKTLVHFDTIVVDNSPLLRKLYKKDHETYQEFTMIGIIEKKNFYLLVMGGADSEEKLNAINKVIRSIKFK